MSTKLRPDLYGPNDRKTAREYGRLIVEAVLEHLGAIAPAAATTGEIQAGFAPANCQRIYVALRKLEKAQRIVHVHEVDRSWWAAEPGYCSTCGKPAHRIALERWWERNRPETQQAWWACGDVGHLLNPGDYTWACDLRPLYRQEERI